MNIELLYAMSKLIVWIIIELSIILVIAMIIAELILQYIDLGKVARLLDRRHRITGMVLSVLFGFITPFCACSTIPVVAGMNKAKLPFGITMSFLFASPVLSFTILGGIAAVFSMKIALVYLIVIALSAIFIGCIMEIAGMSKYIKRVRVEGGMKYTERDEMNSWSIFKIRCKIAVKKGLIACKRIIPFIFMGACLGTLATFFFTEEVIFKYLGPQNFFAVPAAAAIGIPLSIDPAATLSLCLAFHGKGASMGTVMAFLISTIGASVPMFVLLSSIYKKKLIITYVVFIFLIIMTTGYIFNIIGG